MLWIKYKHYFVDIKKLTFKFYLILMKNLHFLFVKYIFIYLFIQINTSKVHVIFYLRFKFKPFRVSSNYSLQILLVSRYLLKKKIVYEYLCVIPLSWYYSTLHAQCITVYYAKNQWNLNLKWKNTLMIYFTLSQQNIVQCTQSFFSIRIIVIQLTIVVGTLYLLITTI